MKRIIAVAVASLLIVTIFTGVYSVGFLKGQNQAYGEVNGIIDEINGSSLFITYPSTLTQVSDALAKK